MSVASWQAKGGLQVKHYSDAESVAAAAAAWLRSCVCAAIEAGGDAVLAVSGGASPWPMYRCLVADDAVPWARVHVVQVDERIAEDGHADRNWTQVADVFGGVVSPENLHPMPVTANDLDEAAAAYAAMLASLSGGAGITAAALGLGADGHTASLFPGDPVESVTDRDVAVTAMAHAGRRRMTLTRPALDAASHVLWHVVGAGKAAMAQRLVDGDDRIPAGAIRRDRAVLMTDCQVTAK
ncbi:MAG: 6-phosphogluconolactonase [Phycisphaerales bacterium]|jgi:6-phosphogluconolactonase|nr:6-phosphogluconolactonase [Phycisphaerales bacterium]